MPSGPTLPQAGTVIAAGIPNPARTPLGKDGSPGPPGPPGDITTTPLNTARAGTISNCNATNTGDTPFGDHDAGTWRQKLNEFILAGAAVTTLRWRMGG